MRKSLILSLVLFLGCSAAIAQSVNTGTISGSPFCGGTNVSVPFTTTGSFGGGNVFTAQLSNAAGSFASPVNIGTLTAAAGPGTITSTIPFATAAGAGYRIRVTASNPAINGPDNAVNLTVTAVTVSSPSFGPTSFCQNQAFNITYTVSCAFSNIGFNNVFTAQLSDATGSFGTPTAIGSLTSTVAGTISASIPSGTPAGTSYRIRIVASNPSVTGPVNISNLTVTAASGNPATPGAGVWNVYGFTAPNFTGYSGFYTENGTAAPNLNFSTQTRWANNTSPASADASSGLAWSGCAITNGTTFSYIYKRQNFPCGYYSISIPNHDDVVTVIIDGATVYTANCCVGNLNNIWTGFLGASSIVEFDLSNSGGTNSNLAVTFAAAANPLTLSPPATVCSGTATTLTVSSSSTASLTYAWTSAPAGFSASGASVIANPAATTTYTVTGTDATTGCTVSNSVLITVAASPSTAITASATTICSGQTTATLTATGANSYTWSSAPAGFSSTSNVVTVNPTVNTTYTVVGSNNCTTSSASKAIVVQNVPVSPAAQTAGTTAWNVFGYNSQAVGTNYEGFYTENGSGTTGYDFNTTTRWGSNTAPSTANATNGTAYSGCTMTNVNYALSFKRTNFTCGYYNIDIPYHDDNITLFINSVQVFQNNNYNPTGDFNVWKGFLNASSTVEFVLLNQSGPGQLQVAFSIASPLTLSPPATICAGTNTPLSATSSPAFPSATYQWTVSPSSSPGITFSSPTSSATFAQSVATTPSGNYIATLTLTDAGGTNCSASSNVVITVNPNPSPAVTPTNPSTSCPAAGVTLTASGGSTYTWSPSTGLNTTTGYQVIASPIVTTTYTVQVSNNCSSLPASSTVTVVPLIASGTAGTNVWNSFGYNSLTIGGNYTGFYTENGSGASGFDFNTATRWASGSAPSTANATNGNAWAGCAMSATSISLSFKRQGFPCGLYTLNILFHDDDFRFLVNGTIVAAHAGCCDVHNAIWTGALDANSLLEFQLLQGGGGSGLQVQFVPVSLPTATQSVWVGNTSTDWFTASNWCSAVPTSTRDVIIPPGAPNNPVIGTPGGAQSKSITIYGPINAGTYSNAIASASLTTSTTFDLSVFGNWTNNGIFNSNSGTVTFTSAGAVSNTITNAFPQTFNNLVINNSQNTTIASGVNMVKGNLTMTLGKLFQNAALEILNGGTTSGASNASYVDGVIKKTGNGFASFVFPVGTGGFYRPIAISAPAAATDSYSAQYFNTNPQGTYTNASRDATLDHVSAAEYWMLNQTAGADPVSVTLSWDTNSGGVGQLSDLRVAGWNLGSAKWKDLGNSATTGNTTKGTATSGGPVSNFGPFTLGTISNKNVLPVELVSFTARKDEQAVLLSWMTASELNSDYFAVERSRDGAAWKQFGPPIKAAGTSADANHYSVRDITPPAGKIYYHLKEVDIDGKATYSEPVSVINDNADAPTAHPNPTSGTVAIDFDNTTAFSLNMINSLGQKVTAPITYTDNGIEVNGSGLIQGVYIFEFLNNGKLTRMRIVIAR